MSNWVWQSSSPMPQQTKAGLKNMKFNLLQKQTSRREVLRGSVTLAGSALLAQFFPASSVRASALCYAQQPSSSTDLLASMRAKFNAAPLETQKLADNVTLLSGPGGSVVVLNGPDGKFVVDTFVAPAWPRLKQATLGRAEKSPALLPPATKFSHWPATTPSLLRGTARSATKRT
jgi:hypothetical protein